MSQAEEQNIGVQAVVKHGRLATTSFSDQCAHFPTTKNRCSFSNVHQFPFNIITDLFLFFKQEKGIFYFMINTVFFK